MRHSDSCLPDGVCSCTRHFPPPVTHFSLSLAPILISLCISRSTAISTAAFFCGIFSPVSNIGRNVESSKKRARWKFCFGEEGQEHEVCVCSTGSLTHQGTKHCCRMGSGVFALARVIHQHARKQQSQH